MLQQTRLILIQFPLLSTRQSLEKKLVFHVLFITSSSWLSKDIRVLGREHF